MVAWGAHRVAQRTSDTTSAEKSAVRSVERKMQVICETQQCFWGA